MGGEGEGSADIAEVHVTHNVQLDSRVVHPFRVLVEHVTKELALHKFCTRVELAHAGRMLHLLEAAGYHKPLYQIGQTSISCFSFPYSFPQLIHGTYRLRCSWYYSSFFVTDFYLLMYLIRILDCYGYCTNTVDSQNVSTENSGLLQIYDYHNVECVALWTTTLSWYVPWIIWGNETIGEWKTFFLLCQWKTLYIGAC